jgi:uncharacterized protein (TIGR02246 family)
MHKIVAGMLGLLLISAGPAFSKDETAAVRATVEAFYKAFDEGFTQPADYATEDWNHINPFGGRDRGREATLATVRAVHQTFLKGVTDTIQEMDVRFASPKVAVATVVSLRSAITMSDGAQRPAERNIRTFVVVKRGGRWLIMQDHNTNVAPPPQ